MSAIKKEYKKEIRKALDNEFLRKSMDNFAVAYKEGQKRAFAGIDKEQLISEIVCSKDTAAANLEALYEQFKAKAAEKGVHVHLADTAEDANRIISEIAAKSGCKRVVKSKSMTAEETHLNTYLEAKNMLVTETDLGEWIIQMRQEGPSHMVMPAIHLSRYQISDLFSGVTKETLDPDNIDKMVKVAREQLRSKFEDADMGVSGANFLLADTATAGIVTNEGNARLATTLPKTHVVLAGMDKLLPGLPDALTILKALPRNATGQAITSYVTWITGQNECFKNDGDKKDIHVVLLDNGRRKLAKDPLFSKVLRCVRCGACANVCPVYRMVGGHTMGHIYIGAIGLILTYFFHGKEKAEKLIGNCIGCGSCKHICAGGIDLPDVIKAVAKDIQGEQGNGMGKLASKVLKNRKLFHTLLKFAKFAQKPVTDNSGYLRHLPMMFAKEHNFKTLPEVAERSFRDMWEELKPSVRAPQMKIAIFAGCVQDFVYPEQLKSFVRLLEGKNIAVEFPMEQSCCGLPLKMMDQHDAARSVAGQNIFAFDPGEYDYIVTLCASCASHLKHAYAKMFNTSDGAVYGKATRFADKVITSGQFLRDVIDLEVSGSAGSGSKVTFHSPCHLTNCMEGGGETPKELIGKTGATFVQAKEEASCCGFGGTYSGKFPQISSEILKRKLEDFEKTGADLIVTECPGCIMQLRGGADKKKMNVQVKHFVELLDDK